MGCVLLNVSEMRNGSMATPVITVAPRWPYVPKYLSANGNRNAWAMRISASRITEYSTIRHR